MHSLKALYLILVGTALAHPVDESPQSLEKRRLPETIHFAQCEVYEDILFYSDDEQSQNGKFPGKNNECVPKPPLLGRESSCTFPTGVVLRYSLGATAYSAPTFAVVGWADNGFHRYTCWRANDALLYVDVNGRRCTGAIYCRYN